MYLPDLLHLLHTAHRNFTTVQVAWRYRYQVEALNELQERWAAQRGSTSVQPLRAKGTGGVQSPSERTMQWHIWWRRPDCWRDETELSGQGRNIRVICPDRWSFYSVADRKLFTNALPDGPQHQQRILRGRQPPGAGQIRPGVEEAVNEVPLLDPAFLLASHELEPGADVQYAEREALQVQAVAHQGKEAARDPFFWGGADDYELLVDKERGVLLRYAAKLRGQDMAVAAVERVVFEALIPDDVFVFTPPPNTTIELTA
jgi:hypothetical protein